MLGYMLGFMLSVKGFGFEKCFGFRLGFNLGVRFSLGLGFYSFCFV